MCSAGFGRRWLRRVLIDGRYQGGGPPYGYLVADSGPHPPSAEEDAKFVGPTALDRTGAVCSPPMRDGAAIADASQQWLLLGLKDHLAVHRIRPA
jgi:hypothetical protein